jgi:hypothetical protein
VFMFRLAGYLLRRWFERKRGEADAAVGCEAIQVEFYRRFEDLLARYDLVRLVGQTPRELAAAVVERLAGPTPVLATAGPGRVVDAFYRVRFGRRTLDSEEAQEIEQALSELEGALAQSQMGGHGQDSANSRQ